MLVAWRRISDFDRTKPFGPWLRGIAANVILARHRKQAPFIQTDAQTLESLSLRFERLQSLQGDTLDEKLQALRDCVDALPDHYQSCIKLRFASGMKPQQISNQLELALEAVKKRLTRAKQKLATCLESKLSSSLETTNTSVQS